MRPRKILVRKVTRFSGTHKGFEEENDKITTVILLPNRTHFEELLNRTKVSAPGMFMYIAQLKDFEK